MSLLDRIKAVPASLKSAATVAVVVTGVGTAADAATVDWSVATDPNLTVPTTAQLTLPVASNPYCTQGICFETPSAAGLRTVNLSGIFAGTDPFLGPVEAELNFTLSAENSNEGLNLDEFVVVSYNPNASLSWFAEMSDNTVESGTLNMLGNNQKDIRSALSLSGPFKTFSINTGDQTFGFASFKGETVALTEDPPAAVPGPVALPLLASGLALLGGVAAVRRRRSAPAAHA